MMNSATINTPSVITLSEAQVKRLNDFNNPFKMGLWMLWKLPSAKFMGLKIENISAEKAEVSLPYGWRSQNPFQSIYFAAQCAAGEMSTGILAILALEGRGPISMLVSKVEAEFVKKATSKTTFKCAQGHEVFDTVERAIQTGEAQTITMISHGVQETGELVSVIKITWSFKAKTAIK